MNTRLGWKVPRRQVYCATFAGWVAETIWCHVVLRIYPNAFDPGPSTRAHVGPK